MCPYLLYWAVQDLTQCSRNGPTGAGWSLLSALLLVQPRIPSAFAGSSSAWCPPGLLLPMCFLASQPPACTGTWACSSLGAGLGASSLSFQPSSSHSGSLWMAAQPSGISGIPPSYVSSSALVRLCPASSSRSLMKVLNRIGPSTDPWGALLPPGLQLDFMQLVTCPHSWFFMAFHLVGYNRCFCLVKYFSSMSLAVLKVMRLILTLAFFLTARLANPLERSKTTCQWP